MNNCMECGKELQVGDRVIWRCEDCARKQMEEYDNKDQRIAELEEQLKKSLESNNNFLKQIMELEAQLIKERLK